jgi:hypothetical protein
VVSIWSDIQLVNRPCGLWAAEVYFGRMWDELAVAHYLLARAHVFMVFCIYGFLFAQLYVFILAIARAADTTYLFLTNTRFTVLVSYE